MTDNFSSSPAAAAEAIFDPDLQRALRWRWLRKYPMLYLGAVLLVLIAATAVFAPWIATHDPLSINPVTRLKPPSAAHYFGTDNLGRDVFSRAMWGGRVSLAVAVAVAVLSTVCGVVLGLAAGFLRWADTIIMRIMDGMMAIPDILLAIALVAIVRPSLTTVIVAITIPQIPRISCSRKIKPGLNVSIAVVKSSILSHPAKVSTAYPLLCNIKLQVSK